MPPTRRGACAGALLAVVTACAHPSPPAQPVTEAVSVRVGSIQAAALEAPLASIPRDVRERGSRLIELFHEAGCRGERLAIVPGVRHDSVVCTLYGSTQETVVVTANFDRAADGTGVVDNWTSVAMLPVLYRALRAEPREHTYHFVGFADTLVGQRGAKRYLRQLGAEGRSQIRAVVALKGLGLDAPAVFREHADPALHRDLRAVSHALDLPLRSPEVRGNLAVDSKAFRARGIPTITVHSFDARSARLLEQSHRDRTTDAIDREAYRETARLMAVYLAYLDRSVSLRVARTTPDVPEVTDDVDGETLPAAIAP